MLMFVDFSLLYVAIHSEEGSPFMIKLFYEWAPVAAREVIKSALNENRISQEDYKDEQTK